MYKMVEITTASYTAIVVIIVRFVFAKTRLRRRPEADEEGLMCLWISFVSSSENEIFEPKHARFSEY